MPGPTNASQPLRRPQEPSTATSTWWRLDLSTRLTDAQLSAHAADTTGVYGITDTGLLVVTSDARLTDQRTPLDTSAKVASANKDGTAAIPSMRTPGTGAQQAAAGNDDRFSMPGHRLRVRGGRVGLHDRSHRRVQARSRLRRRSRGRVPPQPRHQGHSAAGPTNASLVPRTDDSGPPTVRPFRLL